MLDAAQAIRPHLPDLVGQEAERVDRELQRLLTQAQTGATVKIDILRLLSQRDATRRWANDLLKVPQQDRSYERPPGKVQQVTVPKYVCPKGDGRPWYRFSVGDQVPICSKHHIPLVQASS